MSFFKSKEEVMDVVLTPYGKNKLFNGNFKPTYYSFFDDDVVYDLNSCNLEEAQNSIQDRILKESIYLKQQTAYSSSSRNPRDFPDFSNYLGMPLCDADDSEQKVPAFEVSFLEGVIDNVELTSSKWYNTYGSNYIPQINMKEQYIDIVIDYSKTLNTLSNNQISYFNNSQDGTHVWLNISSYVFDIFEHNVEYFNKNFDIQIFKIKDDIMEKLEHSTVIGFDEGSIIDGILQDFVGTPTPTYLPGDFDIEEFSESELLKINSYFNLVLDRIEEEITPNRLYIYDSPVSSDKPGAEPEC